LFQISFCCFIPSRNQPTTTPNCSCTISNCSVPPVISTKADCCVISKSSVLYCLAYILPTFWESMAPSLPLCSPINHSSWVCLILRRKNNLTETSVNVHQSAQQHCQKPEYSTSQENLKNSLIVFTLSLKLA
jgi:hypothetical protein